MSRKKLTARQRATLDALRRYIARHGWPPTVRELGNMLGIASTNGTSSHLAALESKGFISRARLKARCITILDDKHGQPLPNDG